MIHLQRKLLVSFNQEFPWWDNYGYFYDSISFVFNLIGRISKNIEFYKENLLYNRIKIFQ